MKRALALLLGFSAIAVQAEEGASSSQSESSSSKSEAYIRAEQRQAPQEALAPVMESIPSTLNGDFANKPEGTNATSAQEITKADIVLQREQKNWLTVGVQKLSGDYKIDTNLTAEDKEELAEKRASLNSPTLFIDHYARMNRAKSAESNQEQTVNWRDALQDSGLDQPLNFSAGWQDEPVISVHAPSTAPRRNPYLQTPIMEGPSLAVNPVQPSTDLANFRSVTPVDAPRTKSFNPAQLSTTAPISQTLAPSPAPTNAAPTAPATTPLREKRERNEKYFKNLERF